MPPDESVTTDSIDAELGILLRTRDRPIFLRRAIDDILSQTYDDYIVVVVNDAGDQASVEEAVAAVADRASGRFRIVHNEQSDGVDAALNVGIHNSSSRYLAVHDDDDTWAPTFLETTVTHLKSTGARAAATRTAIIWEELNGEEIVEDRCEILAADKTQVTLADVLRRNFVPPTSLVYERALHDEVGLYDTNLSPLADWGFLVSVIAKHPVAFLDGEPQAFWHLRERAAGAAANSVRRAEHVRAEPIVRDQFLRDDIARNGGLGLMLAIAGQFDRLTATTHEQIAGLHVRLEQLASRAEEIERDVEALDRTLVSRNNRIAAQLDLLSNQLTKVARDSASANQQAAEVQDQVTRIYHLALTQMPKARLRRFVDLTARHLRR
jgi:hypothetical protein